MPNIQVYDRKEIPASVEEDGKISPALERKVPVPPFNSSEGWVGFNITLRKEGELDYKAYGIIKITDEQMNIDIGMGIVNETGLADLVFGFFEPGVWENTKVYATAFLNDTKRTGAFYLKGLDKCGKYVVLFRSYKNGTSDTPVYITIMESWLVGAPLVNVMPQVYIVFLATSILGVSITTIGFYLEKKKRRKRLKK